MASSTAKQVSNTGISDAEAKALHRELQTAFMDGDAHRCEALIKRGAPIHDDADWNLLQAACCAGEIEVCKVLLAAGANPNTAKSQPLWLATTGGYADLWRVLVDSGADIEHASDGVTLLMRAASMGDTASCRFLIESGAQVDAVGGNGYTPLMLAARDDRLEEAKMLVAAGADTKIARACGKLPPLTPFQMAVQAGSSKVAQYFLFNLGEDPAQRTAGGKTVLQLARKHAEVRQLLQSVKTAWAIDLSLVAGAPAVATPERRAIRAAL